jgi:hypothetical protein
MGNSTFNRLHKAAKSRYLVAFLYDDLPRVVEVHTLGTLRTGKRAMRGYQVSGDSSKHDVPSWKLFHTDKVKDLSVYRTKSQEIPRPLYTKGDSAFMNITFEV